MPAVSALTQRSQLGVEATSGTAVAASKLLQSIGFTVSPKVTNKIFRPAGQKYGTVATKGRDWSEFAAEGVPTFDEIIYPLSSLLGAAVVTSPDATNAPTARTWTFSPSSVDADTAKTFTIEKGNTARAVRAAYAIFTSLGLDIGRDDVTLDGTVMARALTTGATLTAAPTAIPLVPIVGDQFSLYSDATSAGLGTTKLLDSFKAKWAVSDKVSAVWPLDAAQASYAAHVETDPDPTLELTPSADAVGEAYLGDLRSGVTRFIRLEAVGPTIAAAIKYKLTIDMALKVREVGEYSDEDGTYVLPYTFEMVHDGTWGRAYQVACTNTTAAL